MDIYRPICKEDYKSGKALDKLWDANTTDGKTNQQAALASFFQTSRTLQSLLGSENIKEIQDAVGKSKHIDEIKDFYENSIATGERCKDLLIGS